MPEFAILPETINRTRAASDPANSAFVSANAGSGKTHVLAQRVTRLLLAGHAPSTILCLTFTKAAAAEMQARVFDDLRAWTMMADEELKVSLSKLSGEQPNTISAALRTRARQLFAQALETPGGLRVQTIHAFCEALLHQFPLEAGIAGHFEVMDDALRDLLLASATSEVVSEAYATPDGEAGQALMQILEATSEFGLREGLLALTNQRERFREWVPNRKALPRALQDLTEALGLPEGASRETLLRDHFPLQHLPPSILGIYAFAASSATRTMQAQAERVLSFLDAEDDEDRYAILRELLFKDLNKKPRPKDASTFATNAVERDRPGIRAAFELEAQALVELQHKLAAVKARDLTAALVTLGHNVLERFEREKASRGALDFSDLVSRVAKLLQTGTARHWVQYKLDQGIDHVLVDEAQDTSPPQWLIVRKIVEDYFSGEGARSQSGGRTVFAVGDEKQSIYSFQGARPDLFGAQRLEIKSLAENAKQPFSDVELTQSFRTAAPVLDAVDAVFSEPENSAGISTTSSVPRHQTARAAEPGQVEIWPWEDKEEVSEDADWLAQGDPLAARSPEAKLAERLAADMARRVAEGEQPGDMLALVRSRGNFMEALTGAIKRLNLPVSGVDRFGLTDHIAVQDLMALGRAVLMETDDLSLACALKSPLLGLSEEDLFLVAQGGAEPTDPKGRGDRSLYQALSDLAGTGEHRRLTEALERFDRWRGLADRYGVFGFYSAVLHTDGGRARLLARLGGEAEDPIDTFLDFALSRESEGVPGLDGYLQWLEDNRPVVKRELEQTEGRIRVMTAHGAKGLEARTVYLVDPGSKPQNQTKPDRIIALSPIREGAASPLLWQAPGQLTTEAGANHRLQKAKAEDEEYRRLLYVGMTRARDRLIVCGYRKTTDTENAPAGERRWRDIVQEALVNPKTETEWQARQVDVNGVSVWRWEDPNNPLRLAGDERGSEINRSRLPDSLRAAPPHEGPAAETLSPSMAHDLIAADTIDLELDRSAPFDTRLQSPALLEEREGDAARKGTMVHRLLEQLPGLSAEAREAVARAYLDRVANDWSPASRQDILQQTFAVLDMPELQPLFAGKPEVAISGSLETASGSRIVSGRIDQLAIDGSTVLIADYKTNHTVPETPADVPQAYITQMALYRALLTETFPGHDIQALLIWTSAPKVMRLPSKLLDERLSALINA
ncbi:MAG: double-strand break repair helicase AddA [Pseudomonadota bacterium]